MVTDAMLAAVFLLEQTNIASGKVTTVMLLISKLSFPSYPSGRRSKSSVSWERYIGALAIGLGYPHFRLQ